MFEISGIGVISAFIAGLISFLSPRVLPLVPGYLSFIAGDSFGDNIAPPKATASMRSIYLSSLFIAGFSLVFILLGASASAVGRLLLSYRYEANIVGGSIIIIFGLFMAGLIKPAWFSRDLRYHGKIPKNSPIGAFGLGLAFAFGWTPCIGPILGSILTVSAMSNENFNGIALLSIYSAGLGVPFLLAAIFTHSFASRSNTLRGIGRPLQIAAGLIMVVMGIAMVTGYLTMFSYWLLSTFPILGSIG